MPTLQRMRVILDTACSSQIAKSLVPHRLFSGDKQTIHRCLHVHCCKTDLLIPCSCTLLSTYHYNKLLGLLSSSTFIVLVCKLIRVAGYKKSKQKKNKKKQQLSFRLYTDCHLLKVCLNNGSGNTES